MNDFITKLLAQLFDSFKTKNPKVAAVLILVLVTLVNFAEQGTMLGLISLPEWAAETVKWVSLVLLGILGSRTTQILAHNKAVNQ